MNSSLLHPRGSLPEAKPSADPRSAVTNLTVTTSSPSLTPLPGSSSGAVSSPSQVDEVQPTVQHGSKSEAIGSTEAEQLGWELICSFKSKGKRDLPEGTAVVIKFGTSPSTRTVSPVKETNRFDVLSSYEPEDKVIHGGSKDMSEQLTEEQLLEEEALEFLSLNTSRMEALFKKGKNKRKKVVTKDGEATYYITKGPDVYKGESRDGPTDVSLKKVKGHRVGVVKSKSFNKVQDTYHKFGGKQRHTQGSFNVDVNHRHAKVGYYANQWHPKKNRKEAIDNLSRRSAARKIQKSWKKKVFNNAINEMYVMPSNAAKEIKQQRQPRYGPLKYQSVGLFEENIRQVSQLSHRFKTEPKVSERILEDACANAYNKDWHAQYSPALNIAELCQGLHRKGLSTKKVTEIWVQAGGDPETTSFCLEVIAREKDRKQGPYKDTRRRHSCDPNWGQTRKQIRTARY